MLCSVKERGAGAKGSGVSAIDIDERPAVAPGPVALISTRPIRVGLLGCGQVGRAVATLLAREASTFAREGLQVRVTAALVREREKLRSGPAVPIVTDAAEFFRHPVDVIVEVMGGVDPAHALVSEALRRGVPVVTANKTLIAHHGPELRALAAAHGTPLLFDAAVLAGVPCLGALTRRPLISSICRLTGIVNGTSHFITTAVARGASFGAALAEAETLGLAEPDSSADVGGRDAAEKLAILLQLAGAGAPDPAVFPRLGIDGLAPADFIAARRLGGTIKPVVIAALEAPGRGTWVGPAFVAESHPLARLDGVENALRLTREDGHVVTFAGPGAGPEVTAVTVVDDLLEIAAGAAQVTRPRPRLRDFAGATLASPMDAGWFLRIRGADAWRGTTIEQRLASRHLRALGIASLGGTWFARTTSASAHQLQYAVTSLRTHGADVLAIPVVE